MADHFTTRIAKMDDSFSAEDTIHYGLALIAGEEDLSYCINDLRRGKYIGLHHLTWNTGTGGTHGTEKIDYRERMAELVYHVPYLRNVYKIVKIAFRGRKTTLIPSQVFDPSELAVYFRFAYGESSDPLMADHLNGPDAYQVFSVPSQAARAFSEFYDRQKVLSSSSVFIESIFMNYRSRTKQSRVFLLLHAGFMEMMVFDGARMTYFNAFVAHAREDVAYYLIFVMEQLNLNPEQVPVILYSDEILDEELMELLTRYVRQVEHGRRSTFFKYSHVLKDVSSYSYYPLFNLLSCGL